MKKLLQICVEGNRGSTGTIAESIGEYVIANNWESYIAIGRFPRSSKSNLIRIGNYISVLLHVLETRIFDNHGFGSRFATKRLIKKITKIKPDVIHLHHLHGYYINIKILFKYLSSSGIPVIWTFHDCWSFTGHCTHFDKIGCFKWKTECNHCPQKKEYPKSLIIDNSKKNYYLKHRIFSSAKNLTIVSVSKWLDNIVSQSFLKDINHNIIYNGIDINVFNYNYKSKLKLIDSNPMLNNKYIILGVANTWSSSKGLDAFVQLSKIIKFNEIILLVGLNDKQIRQLPNNILGISRTENVSELASIYAIADVYLNLSVEETFGLTTTEALACGTPVIVYNSTASPELVDDNVGFIVEKYNINKVYDAINKIKSKGKSYYSDHCRNRAISLFDKNICFKNYMKLYISKINNNS